MRICVVIPAYNEEKRIEALVRRINDRDLDVMIVDDGSRDNTAELARRAGAITLRHERNRGKGAALVTGFKEALSRGYDAVITMDGDGQHLVEDIPHFISAYARDNADMFVGDRMHNPHNMPRVRLYTNTFMSWLVSLLARQSIHDTQCGFRLLRRAVLENLNLVTTNYEIESEMLIKAARLGYRIGSVRINSVYQGQKSSIHPFLDTLRFIRYLLVELFTRAKKSPVKGSHTA